MRISDWSSDVCSSDLPIAARDRRSRQPAQTERHADLAFPHGEYPRCRVERVEQLRVGCGADQPAGRQEFARNVALSGGEPGQRSEEQTSELQSLMRHSYAVFCLTKTKHTTNYS